MNVCMTLVALGGIIFAMAGNCKPEGLPSLGSSTVASPSSAPAGSDAEAAGAGSVEIGAILTRFMQVKEGLHWSLEEAQENLAQERTLREAQVPAPEAKHSALLSNGRHGLVDCHAEQFVSWPRSPRVPSGPVREGLAKTS